ncbi:hypothetical protein F7R26_032275 [Cupriavidus basilensis]|uniref:DNA polymerase III alpha subunit finger domain-containing protein n=1 Tax=Cupriavidus basilensis TaxID=68895 RepID=A0A643FT80_9BURK|nr:hypothetical protein F7R26_032275 [Cupriavidus basilensis]
MIRVSVLTSIFEWRCRAFCDVCGLARSPSTQYQARHFGGSGCCTLGGPIFQEQVMQVAMLAAGFSAGEADQLCRVMEEHANPVASTEGAEVVSDDARWASR